MLSDACINTKYYLIVQRNSRQVVLWYRLIDMSPPHVAVESPAQGVEQMPSPWRSKSVFVSLSVMSHPAHQHLVTDSIAYGKPTVLSVFRFTAAHIYLLMLRVD